MKTKQNSEHVGAEPMAIAVSVVNWGNGNDTAASSKCSQGLKQSEVPHLRGDQMELADESLLQLKKIYKMQ